jgi:integrase
MRRDLAAGTGKKIYVDYCSVIERYFIPYFGDKYLQNLKHKDIAEFEAWRNHRMARTPKSSTLMTFASAFSRVHQTAIARGWISDRVPIPTMTRRGAKGEVRPAFSVEEIAQLRQFMVSWQQQGNLDYDRIMRPLLCAYVEFLLLTGMRHGTESMGVEWRHCEWYSSEGNRYIRVWVDGKTGGRWLIAKHQAQAVLAKLHSLQPDIAGIPIEQVMGRDTKYLFRRPDGQRPRTFNGMFSKLMRESGLRWNHTNQSRTLYSLRHSYATMELLAETDIHTLARQMGTSVRMLEAHYSKLTATMAAERLA